MIWSIVVFICYIYWVFFKINNGLWSGRKEEKKVIKREFSNAKLGSRKREKRLKLVGGLEDFFGIDGKGQTFVSLFVSLVHVCLYMCIYIYIYCIYSKVAVVDGSHATR